MLLLRHAYLLSLSLLVLLTTSCSPPRHPRPVVDTPGTSKRLLVLAQHLPMDETLAVVATPDLGRFLDALNRSVEGTELATPREKAALQIAREFGEDFTRRDGWSNLGVDIAAPALLASVDASLEEWVLAVHLADVDQFRAALYRRQDELRLSFRGFEGDALLLRSRQFAVMIKGDVAMLARSSGGATRLRRYAQLAADASLAERPEFLRNVASVEGGGELWFYGAPRTLAYLKKLDPRWSGRNLSEAAEQVELMQRLMLASVRKSGGDPEVLIRIDRRYRRAMMELRDDATAAVLRRTFGGMGGASLSVRLRDDKLRGAARLWVPEKGAGSAWLHGEGVPQPLAAGGMNGNALRALGHVEPATLLDVLETAVPGFGAWRRQRSALNELLIDALDGRVFVGARLNPMRLGARLKVKSVGQGKQLLALLQKANNARPDDAETRDESSSLLPAPAGAVRTWLDGNAYDISLDGDDLLIATAGTIVAPWPAQSPTQLRIEVAIGELLLPPVPELELSELSKRNPAQTTSAEYQKAIAEAAKLASEYAEMAVIARNKRKQELRRMGIAGLSARQTGDHIDVALDQGRGLGFRQLLAAPRSSDLAVLYYEQYRLQRAHAEALARADNLSRQALHRRLSAPANSEGLRMRGVGEGGTVVEPTAAEPSAAEPSTTEPSTTEPSATESGVPEGHAAPPGN